MSKQKPKRDKKYIPKTDKKFNGVKPKKQIEITTKNMINGNLLDDYIEWNEKENFDDFKDDVNEFFRGWYGMSYTKDSQMGKDTNLFIEWYKKQKKNNMKVFAFDRSTFIEYKIKKIFTLPVKDDRENLFLEITPNTKEGKGKAHLNTSNIDREAINNMIVYNGNNHSFSFEKEIIEVEKIIIKKEIINQEVNKDKTDKLKNKIEKYLKTKDFEKSYLGNIEDLRENILKILK
jgi:hypothetical protein